ncbi:AAA family ATPase [uncultured Spirosoma sp.]|uniref:AAA family ATPase n=1 Tax=uncultured Spirosoma sp. TaxID=278208 RepID=UPI002582F459|nr:AAA family ATPase [uncultured Spirosoma sp.]
MNSPNHTPPPVVDQPSKNTSFVDDFRQHLDGLVNDQESTASQPTPVATNSPDIAAVLAAAEVRASDQISEPPVCLTIQHDNHQSVVGTLGNFSLIIGKAKSRKTFVVGIAIAAAVKQDRILSRFTGSLPADRQTVLYFDTEQGRYHVQRAVKRICDLCSIAEPTNLKTYSLRSVPTLTRLEAIRWAIYHTPDVGLIVIDGIRDLVFDPNDPVTAAQCASNLLKWTEELQVHILTVLHQNKGDTNARGHLGTELVNKAETVISISRDNENRDVSVVAPEYCRDKDFESFAFSVDTQGLPYLIDEPPVSSNNRRSHKSTAASLKPDEVLSIIRRAFANDEQLRYAQLRTNLIEASEFVGATLAKSRAETLITRIRTEGYIIKTRPPRQRYEVYQINPEKIPV